MRIQVSPQSHEVDPAEQRTVKEFLLRSFKNEAANWTENIHCTIFVDGKTMRIMKGSCYQMYSKDIYVSHNGIDPPPHWVPAVLLAIMFFFKLDSDAQLKTLAVELLAKVMADAISPHQALLVQTFSGTELTEIAIDTETRTLLAKYPPLELGGPNRWVSANGEERELSDTIHSFPVPDRS